VLIVGISAGTANAIIAIAGLSFIGLGIQAPAFDWGRMLTEGVNAFYVNPAAALGPALFVSAAALGFGFSGEGVARAMNPLLWAKPVKRKSGEAEEGHDREDREVATPLPLPLDGDRLHVGNGAAPKSDGNVVLDVRNLRVVFPGHPTPIEIVKGVDFSVSEGEVLGIVGESGSGKTMTSLAVAQLVPHPGSVTGSVRLNGEELSELPRAKLDKLLGTSVAVVFQDPMSSLNPALTIGVQLTEGVQKHLHEPPDKARTEAIARLNEVNIPTPRVQLDRHPHELSGGMRQRVMIAMGLMTNPRLLIADEPTTALDVTIQAQIMDLLEQVNEDHRTAVILISHNLGLVRQNCDRVLVMYAGRIVEELPSDRLTIDPLHPYTRALLAAVPDIAHDRSQPLEFIPGQTPDIGNPPRGCPYHPRCPLAMDICRERTPPLERHGIDRRVACWAAEQVKA
jgi:oligopeptide/dipeptide ABC transporter ATP-binding protein